VDRPSAKYVPGQLLVRFRSQAGADSIANVKASVGARTLRVFPFLPGLQLLQLQPGASVTAAASAFATSSDVRYAQPNWVSHIDASSGTARTPNDPLYGQQWGWPKIKAPAAWNLTVGSKSVVVGDIDTGIDYNHVDLKKSVWRNTAECKGVPGEDDDHNGYVDDCHGIDPIDGDTDPLDNNGHGTHTGGTIAGCGAIHENVVRPGQSLGQVRRPAQAAVRCGERRQPVSIPADEHQVGHQPVAVA
jgi:subtilisin family serine protease